MYYRIKEDKLYDWAQYKYTDEAQFIEIDYATFEPEKYAVIDGVLTDISNTPEYIAEQELKERERIARLKMTKLDFFKYVVLPTGTTYAGLLTAVSSNDLLQATWNLCNHVYRGDEVMNTYATKLLGVSAEQLDDVFAEYGN